MEDKVDILITTYNTEIKYLKEQIKSILNQTYKNLNILISDDCSTKKEVKEVLEEYKNKDDRIILFFQDNNLGYTKNFEFLLTKSTSNYISFCDHDDIWYPNKIEVSLKKLKEENVDLVYCDANQIDKDGKLLHKSYLKYKNMPIMNGNNSILAFSRHIAIGCCQLFTKEVKEKMLPFTSNTMAHDWNSVYIATRLKGIYCIEQSLMGYRLHGNNAFGGRSFKENISRWKKENGNTYKSYLKYRYKVITETYMAGSLMCKEYGKRFEQDEKKYNTEKEVLNYYEKAQNTKVLLLRFNKYFKYLKFKGIGKKAIKEILILHFPLLSYLIYIIL